MGVKLAGGLAAILLAVVLAAAPGPATAAETTKLAPPGAPFDIDRALGVDAHDVEMSWSDVESAWVILGVTIPRRPLRAENHFQYLMLNTTSDVIARHQKRLDALDWHPKFKALFAKARAWRQELNAMSMDEVYEVRNSLHRLAKITEEKNQKNHYTYLARQLNYRLTSLHHMPTMFEFALEKLNRNNELDTEDALAWIKFLADHGDYAPAQIYGAQLYMKLSEGKTSAIADRARMGAYFWLRKAVRSDPTIRGLVKKARRLLTPAQIEKVESWLKKYPR